MHLRTLHLENFRNYLNLNINLPVGLSLFYGQNGQGKTNLIEAIQLLTTGKTFRPGNTADLLQNQAEFSRVEGSVDKNVGNFSLTLTLQPQSKKWQLNGKSISSFKVAKEFPAVLFSPESLSVIKSGPEARRTFLDETLASFSLGHARALEDYVRALRVRNRVLRDAVQQRLPAQQAHSLLASVDPGFITAATSLVLARLDTLKKLAHDFDALAHRIDPSLRVTVAVDYLMSEQLANDWDAEQIDSALRQRAIELRARELATGHSLVGPHKHDVRILYGGKDSRTWCSQGQQRALILSFKLARIVYHYSVHKSYPFLLLDDVLSELDSDKRENLVSVLSRMQGQIFVTSTEKTTGLSTLEQTVFHVRSGTIELK